VAVLDIDLGGETGADVAILLTERGIPNNQRSLTRRGLVAALALLENLGSLRIGGSPMLEGFAHLDAGRRQTQSFLVLNHQSALDEPVSNDGVIIGQRSVLRDPF